MAGQDESAGFKVVHGVLAVDLDRVRRRRRAGSGVRRLRSTAASDEGHIQNGCVS